jgi:hypothetical protein
MQCRQDNQDLGPDNRRAHWLAPDGALGLVSLLPLCSSCSCLHVALTDLSPTQCQFGLLQRRWRFACQWQR